MTFVFVKIYNSFLEVDVDVDFNVGAVAGIYVDDNIDIDIDWGCCYLDDKTLNNILL